METTDKTYLVKLIGNLEQCCREGKSLPFRVEKMLATGFLVKVGGLFSFVPFNKMPWNYFKFEGAWAAVFPTIKGKTFFCTIEKIEKDPLKVYLDPGAHRFGQMPLTMGQAYDCMVVHDAGYGYFVDMGLHFGWKYGSKIGLLHRAAIRPGNLDKSSLAVGKTISLKYFGETKKGPILGDEARAAFLKEITDDLPGQLVPVLVSRETDGKPCFRVNGKFTCSLPVNKHNYPGHRKALLKDALANLKDGAILDCEVVTINYKDCKLMVKWVASRLGPAENF